MIPENTLPITPLETPLQGEQAKDQNVLAAAQGINFQQIMKWKHSLNERIQRLGDENLRSILHDMVNPSFEE